MTLHLRSRIFSLFLGLLFTGIAAGPTLGAIFIRLTGSVLSVFFFASGIHVLYALLIWFILPESRTVRLMRASKVLHQEELNGLKEEQSSFFVYRLVARFKSIFSFLSPLLLLLPRRAPGSSPLKPGRRDWNLTLITIAYGLVYTIMGSVAYKFQYAQAKFSWNSENVCPHVTRAPDAMLTKHQL